MTGPVQGEHQSPAHHVAWLPIGLHPIPGLAELLRQGAATEGRMDVNQLLDEGHVGIRDLATAILHFHVHDLQGSRPTFGTQELLPLFSFRGLTGRQSGAACVPAGLPAERSTCS